MTELFDQLKEFAVRGVAAQRAVDNIVPLSHKSDPITSYEAADKMVKSGALNEQEIYVLAHICKFIAMRTLVVDWYWGDTFTPKELAQWMTPKWEYTKIYQIIQRRLSGLHSKGKIERTGEKREGCMVWKLKGE